MAVKTACSKCGAENYPSDRQCLSCGARLSGTPADQPPASEVNPSRVAAQRRPVGDDRNWWRRRTDDVIEYQQGALIGMVAACVALALIVAIGGGGGLGAAFGSLLFFGISAYCFVWYTRDPDSVWPLIVCIVLSSLVGWVLIAMGAFAGAAIERRLQKS